MRCASGRRQFAGLVGHSSPDTSCRDDTVCQMSGDRRLEACLRAWRLSDPERLAGGFHSEVFRCWTHNGDTVVVKLASTASETEAEAEALSLWAGSGAAVTLLDVNVAQAALLLDEARPGTALPADDDHTAVQVAADTMRRLHFAPPPGCRFPGLDVVYPKLEHRAAQDAAYEQSVRSDRNRGRAGLQALPAARATAMRLCATARQIVVLHGDLLDKNLLWNGSRYLAIDPMPRVGDRCSELGFFAACHPPATHVLQRASALAALLDEDRERVLRWSAVWTVLQATQAWRDDQAMLDASLANSDFQDLLAE